MGDPVYLGGIMSTSPKKPRSAANQTLPADIQRAIELQTDAFLKSGGQIQQIANGISGQAAQFGRQIAWQTKSAAQVVPVTDHERVMNGNEE
jgi:hypothetical protein